MAGAAVLAPLPMLTGKARLPAMLELSSSPPTKYVVVTIIVIQISNKLTADLHINSAKYNF